MLNKSLLICTMLLAFRLNGTFSFQQRWKWKNM